MNIYRVLFMMFLCGLGASAWQPAIVHAEAPTTNKKSPETITLSKSKFLELLKAHRNANAFRKAVEEQNKRLQQDLDRLKNATNCS